MSAIEVLVHVPSSAPAELIDYLDGQVKILLAESAGRYTVELVVEATCRVCGCTDYESCVGGCWWVDDEFYLCSSCAGGAP